MTHPAYTALDGVTREAIYAWGEDYWDLKTYRDVALKPREGKDAMLAQEVAKIAFAYLQCALWAETAMVEEGSDESYEQLGCEVSDFTEEAIADAIKFVCDFLDHSDSTVQAIQDQFGATAESIGQDLWLTRTGHGVGFWDRGYGPLGDALTAACKPHGSAYITDGGVSPYGDRMLSIA